MQTLVNICGAGRSGTTVLDLILGNGSNAFSLGEVYALHRPWRSHHFKITCGCGQNPCEHWSLIKDADESVFHKEAFGKLGVDFLIDSSKNINWIIDNNLWAKQAGFRVVNILLWKSPQELAPSYWKRGRSNEDLVQEYNKYYGNFVACKIPFISVNYEWLFSSTGENVSKLCESIGMDYFPGKEVFQNGRSHHLFGSKGTRAQLAGLAGFVDKDMINNSEEAGVRLQALLDEDQVLKKTSMSLGRGELECVRYDAAVRKNSLYYIRKVIAVYKKICPTVWRHDQ